MLRFRLGLLVAAALIVALAASGWATLALFERLQRQEAEALLEREVARVDRLLREGAVGASFIDPGVGPLRLQFVASDGTVVVPTGEVALPEVEETTWTQHEGAEVVAISTPWRLGSGTEIGTIRIVYDATGAASTRATLRTSLALAGGVIVILTGLASVLWLERELRPLARLAERAGALDPTAPHLEPTPQRDDEVGRLAAALQRAVDAIRERQRQERDALAGVAHELAAPLTVVAGRLEALADNDSDPRLHAARDAARELLYTSQDLLTLARGEVQVPIEFETVALADVARAVVAEYPGVTFTRDDDGVVLGSPERLKQIVRNLVRNATQATAAPGVEVRVGRADEVVELVVKDDGPGIAPEELERVFDRTYTRRANAGGHGLGLHVVRELVQAHGGDVSARSTLGRGSSFRVRLPALESQLDDG